MSLNNKVFLLPDRLAHYREPVFLEIAKILKNKSKTLYLFYDPNDFQITKIPIPKLEKLQKFYKIFHVKNLYLSKAVIFQFGIIGKFIIKRPHILIAWGESQRISTFIILLISKLLKTKVVLWTHGFYGNEKIIKKAWRTFFYNLADKLLIYGRYSTTIAEELLPNKEIYTIGNSLLLDKSKFEFIDKDSFAKHKSSIFEKYGINKKKFMELNKNCTILSFVGRLTQAKRLDLIIKLLARNSSNNLVFWIIGSGSEYKTLFDYAKKLKVLDRVHFFGEIYNQSKIKSILSVSDIFVCPKNLGLSVCNALASGLPIITTKNMEAQMPESECLFDFEYSEFVDFENQKLLLDKINLMSKKILLDFKSKFKIVEHYYKNFDPETHASRIVNAIDDII